MTSMFWTARSASVAIGSAKKNGGCESAVFSQLMKVLHRVVRAVARSDVLLLRVLRRVGFDHGAYQLAIRLHPVGNDLPLGAVPLLELHQAGSFVVHARHLDRRHQANGAQLLQALVVYVQMFNPPAHLLAG